LHNLKSVAKVRE